MSFAPLESYLPKFITESIREALPIFGRKIRGFDMEGAVLCGPGPVPPARSEWFGHNGGLQHKGHISLRRGRRVCGGIMSAAVDGIKTAQSIMEATENDG